ncbi:MAG: BLUF domain-containing protein [Alcaligenaceae bacterium]
MTVPVDQEVAEAPKAFALIYVSAAVTPKTQAELASLLVQFRKNNQKNNIAGMLLFKDPFFLQVLEGKESDVRLLYKKIEADPRHHRLEILYEGPQQQQEFSDWSMAFHDLDDRTSRSIQGYSEDLNTPLQDALALHDQPKLRQFISLFMLDLIPRSRLALKLKGL